MVEPKSGEIDERLHGEAAIRLAADEQRYTSSRRALMKALASAGRPLTTPEILQQVGKATISSTYRNLVVLCEAKVARKLSGADDVSRYELAEDLSGHHHHLVCSSCGTMVDVEAAPRLERSIAEASRVAAELHGFEVTAHRIDFEGTCSSCINTKPKATAT